MTSWIHWRKLIDIYSPRKYNTCMMNKEVILSAMTAQLAKPTRAVVNSESAFVAQRLRDAGHMDEAKAYWSWVCCGKPKTFGEDIHTLQMQLDALDTPLDSSWTKGT